MRFRYLLWDMDGTLFDTYPGINRAVVDAFAEFGAAVDRAVVAELLTETVGYCIEVLAARYGVDEPAVFDAYLRRAQAMPEVTHPPFPGALRICRRLIAAGGANYIFTHRNRVSLDRFLAVHGMADLFADTLTLDQGYPRKPDPGGFLAIIARNKLPKAEVLAVGDRDLDIQAGIGAGIRTCLYRTVPSPDARPDYVIQDYAELEELLFGV